MNAGTAAMARRVVFSLSLCVALSLGCLGRKADDTRCHFVLPYSRVNAFIGTAEAADSSLIEAISPADAPRDAGEWRIVDVSHPGPGFICTPAIASDSVMRLERSRERLERMKVVLAGSVVHYEAEYEKRRSHVVRLMEMNRAAISGEEGEMIGRILGFIDEAERKREEAAARCSALRNDCVAFQNRLAARAKGEAGATIVERTCSCFA